MDEHLIGDHNRGPASVPYWGTLRRPAAPAGASERNGVPQVPLSSALAQSPMQGIQPEDPGRFLSDARHPFSHESYYPTIDHSDTRSPVPEHLALHSFPSPTHTPNYHQYLPWPGAYSAAVNDSEGQAFQDISIPTDSTYGHGNLDQQPHERRGMTVDAASGSPVPEDHLIAGATGGVRFSQVSTNRTIYEYHEPFNVKAESDHHEQSTSLPAIADGITTRDKLPGSTPADSVSGTAGDSEQAWAALEAMVRRTRCNVGGSTCTGYIPEGTAEDVQTHLETCHADQLNRAPKGENGRVECLLRECSTKVKMGRLGKHMEEKHLGRRRTQCDGCGKWLSRPDALKRHKKRFHKGVEASITETN